MDEQSLHTDTVHDWITGYLTNSLTPEEMQSFQEWLNASEENRKYFSDIQEVWIDASNEAPALSQTSVPSGRYNLVFEPYGASMEIWVNCLRITLFPVWKAIVPQIKTMIVIAAAYIHGRSWKALRLLIPCWVVSPGTFLCIFLAFYPTLLF